jgi:nucleotide-binding universal stress UspA family protein
MVETGTTAPDPAATDLPVVVGYNGTSHSQDALLWAADEAGRRQAPLLVLYAANYPGMLVDPGPGLLELEPGALDAAREVTARGVRAALQAHPDVRVLGATEVTGPSEALIAESTRASMVVVGTRGYGRIVGSLLGSVAFAAAARAECPVVVVTGVPPDAPGGPSGPESRIVVGTDGSAEADAAVAFAADRAATATADLEIVTSAEDRPGIGQDELHAAALSVVQSAAARVGEAHPTLRVTTRVEDRPAERTLVDASADADLVVVGTRGRGAFEGMLLGSVSHAVIYGSWCPVAIIGTDMGW